MSDNIKKDYVCTSRRTNFWVVPPKMTDNALELPDIDEAFRILQRAI
jgi:hypothetical protein